MLYIRQGATHKVVLGPAVAVADGFTPVTNLALSSADEAEVILHDNATVVDISGYTWAAITTADGYYHLTLQSGISNTVGHVTVAVNDDSLCLPLRADFTVVEEAVYDKLFAANATGNTAATLTIASDLVIVASDLLQVYSDTTRIDSNTVLAETNISDIESSLVIIKSDLIVIDDLASDVHSSLVIAKSDLVRLTGPADGTAGAFPELGITDQGTAQSATATTVVLRSAAAFADDTLIGQTIMVHGSTQGYWQSRGITDNTLSDDTVTVATWDVTPSGTITYKIFGTAPAGSGALTATQSSQLTRIQSDLIIAQSDIIIIGSDIVVLDNLASDIHSSLVIAKSDLVISNSDTTAIHTQTTTIASDLVQVYSDTTRIDSNTVLAETNISDIESSLVIIKSDLVVITSDIGDIIVGEGGLTSDQDSKLTRIASDVIALDVPISDIESSLVIIKSDLVISNSDTTAIHTQTTTIASDLVQVYSDTTKIHSDTTVLETGVHVTSVAGETLQGAGTEADPWRPA